MQLALLIVVVSCQRDINSPEYQSLSKKALQPSFQWNFDEYKFKKVGELESFLPIDDDTWGEFLIQQNGFDGKFNFIQHRRSFDELEYFYLINGWATYEDSQAPDFGKPEQECNELFGYDAWSFSKNMVNLTDHQYEKGDICERTEAPADQGCLVRITEYNVTNCLEFTEEYPEVMDQYYSQQAGLFNVSIRTNVGEACTNKEDVVYVVEQWRTEMDYYMSASNDEYFNELSQMSGFVVNAKYPSRDNGFSIINALSSKFKDEGFPSDGTTDDTNDGCSEMLLSSLLVFILGSLYY